LAVGTARHHAAMPAPLSIACLPFTASADAAANAALIERGIVDADARGARVLLTPECCLPGYPSAARDDLAGVDWCQVAELEDRLAVAAQRRGLLLVLGTASPHDGGVSNDALACGAVPPVRYRKRCLTPTDRAHFVAANRAVTVTFAGWTFGLGICFDLRFGDVFRDLAVAGADAFLVIAHMAGPDPDPGTKALIVPQLCAVRAAEWATPLAFCTTSVADRYCDSSVHDARGLRVAGAAQGLFLATLTAREELDPWYAGLRATGLGRADGRRG